MQLFHSTADAYETLGPDNDSEYVRVGYPGIHEVYRFDWNTRMEQGVMNFLYHSWGSNPNTNNET